MSFALLRSRTSQTANPHLALVASYIRNIVPIGALFSASLVFSNLAYITLSVSFIQMCVTSVWLERL